MPIACLLAALSLLPGQSATDVRPALVYGSTVTKEQVDSALSHLTDGKYLADNGWIGLERTGLKILVHKASVGFAETERVTSFYKSLTKQFQAGLKSGIATFDRANGADAALLDHVASFYPQLGALGPGAVEASVSLGVVLNIKKGDASQFLHIPKPSVTTTEPKPAVLVVSSDKAGRPPAEQRGGSEIRVLTPGRSDVREANGARVVALRAVADELDRLDTARKASLDALATTAPIRDLLDSLRDLSRLPAWAQTGIESRLGGGYDQFVANGRVISSLPSVTIVIRVALAPNRIEGFALTLPLK